MSHWERNFNSHGTSGDKCEQERLCFFFEIKVQQLRPYLSHLGQIWTQLLNFWNKLWSGSFIGIEAICKIYLSFEIINVLKISYDILYDEN